MIYYLGVTKEKIELGFSFKKPEGGIVMSKLTRNQIETSIIMGSYGVALIAGAVEGAIKHRAIFKKDGISEEEKSLGRKATYTKWAASAVFTAATAVAVTKATKGISIEAETVSELGKEVE